MFRDALSPVQWMQVAANGRQMRRVMAVVAISGAIGVFAFAWDRGSGSEQIQVRYRSSDAFGGLLCG